MKSKITLFSSIRALLCSIFMFIAVLGFSQVKITGTVLFPDGSAAIGAIVNEKGTSNSTITNIDGQFNIDVSVTNAVLIMSYVGMKDLEVKLNGRNQIDVQFLDGTLLDDVVVTASRSAMRRLEAPATVETVSAARLEALKPESYNEALQNVPGVFVNPNQGRRNNIRLRGFPDGTPLGGMAYTAVLLDGIPTLATPGKLPENGFGFDSNIDRVELVKGSAATLYGRGAAAGVINMITKTGGEKLGGTARITYYDDILGKGGFNNRIDFNLNGPISENLRFNVGGWHLNDTGFRNTGYNDKGFQIRGNVDYLFAKNKGSIRVYGQYADFNFQNLTDVAVDANTLKLADGWKNTDTYNFPNAADMNFKVYTRNANGSWNDEGTRNFGDALAGGSYAKGFHAGARLRYDLGNGFEIENHIRMQNMDTGVKYSFALPAFYNANNVARLLLDGDNEDQEIINDFKIIKSLSTGNIQHKFSAGFYLSNIDLLPVTYNFLHGSTTDPNNLRLQHPFTGAPVADLSGDIDNSFPAFPGGPLVRLNGLTRRGDYTESVRSFSLGNEMKIGDKLNVLLGFRYDFLNIDMKETKFPVDRTLERNEKFDDWSGTIGFNYLLTDKSAVYGNLNRAFRMPDYTAFTALEWKRINPNPAVGNDETFLRAPDGINANEIIFNYELGYRNTIGDVSIDAAAFLTNINNRLAAIFEDGILQSKPLGDNRIMGGELSVIYRPSAIKGLTLQTSYTYQNAQFTNFKISTTADPNKELFGNTIEIVNETTKLINLKGNRLPGVPQNMFNLLVDYSHKYFGANIGYNVVNSRFQDATNILMLPELPTLNIGVYGNIPVGDNSLKVGVQIRNATNNQNLVSIAATSDNDAILLRNQQAPEMRAALAHGYIQLPRRTMVYASYTF